MAHRYTFLIALAIPFTTNAQNLVANGDFEDGGGNFDITGWNWFCSVPEYFPSDACSGAWSLGIPANDNLSTCFSNGELVGLHTHLVGLQVGVPYELTFCEKVDPNIGGDVGILAVPAGETPNTFASTTLINTWPVFGVPDAWMQDNVEFTVPTAYAGMDFYLFIEYSAAPDALPSPKFFDSFSVIDQSSMDIAETTANTFSIFPDPASDRINVRSITPGMMVDLMNMDGRILKCVVPNNEGMIDVTDLPCGIHAVRAGTLIARFVKQ